MYMMYGSADRCFFCAVLYIAEPTRKKNSLKNKVTKQEKYQLNEIKMKPTQRQPDRVYTI